MVSLTPSRRAPLRPSDGLGRSPVPRDDALHVLDGLPLAAGTAGAAGAAVARIDTGLTGAVDGRGRRRRRGYARRQLLAAVAGRGLRGRSGGLRQGLDLGRLVIVSDRARPTLPGLRHVGRDRSDPTQLDPTPWPDRRALLRSGLRRLGAQFSSGCRDAPSASPSPPRPSPFRRDARTRQDARARATPPLPLAAPARSHAKGREPRPARRRGEGATPTRRDAAVQPA